MRTQAQAMFYPEMLLLEASRGPINWIYADSKKLPTTGIGNLLGSTSALGRDALEMPWRFANRDWATQAEKQSEWHRLRDANIKGDGYAYEKSALLFLDQEDVQRLFAAKAASMEGNVRGFIPGWADLRADAQLAAMSMVWNVGENMFNPKSTKYWPNLSAALKAQDYVRASDNCLINGTTSERNRRNRKMFLNAARAKVMGQPAGALFGAVVKVSASHIINATAGKPGSHAFWAQALLRDAGAYTSALDGLFGPVSRSAWSRATGESKPTKAGLDKLCEASKWTLGIEAGA